MSLDRIHLADDRFFGLVSFGDLSSEASLENLSGVPASPGPHVTDMVRRCEEAWATRLRDLTCEQVRLLASQRLGLHWLARPLVEFVRRYPTVTVTNYPGEMALLCWFAADDLVEAAGSELREWLQGDFDWIEATFGVSRPLLREARDALAHAKRAAGLE